MSENTLTHYVMCFLFKVCAEPDGHLWGRLCGDLDRSLGGHLPYVDLWSLQLFKGDNKILQIFVKTFHSRTYH